jgi:ribokinase
MTAARVLVVGDANLDLVLRGDVVPRFGQAEQLLASADVVLGSSAGICASGLARLGVPTALCARVGTDLFGEETRRLLGEAGVEDTELRTVGAPTGLSVILSAPEDRGILTLTGAMALLDAGDVLPAAERFGATHVHVASFFLVPDLQRSIAPVLEELRMRGVTTSLDTNWDPAEEWSGVRECLPHVDVLLPNAAEAVALARALGSVAATPLDAARALAAHGPVVAVKNGAEGGFAVQGRVTVSAPPPAVQVVDTTGAGDSFDAGFLEAWLGGGELTECVRRAAAAGALSTRGPGGTGAQATPAELEAALS